MEPLKTGMVNWLAGICLHCRQMPAPKANACAEGNCLRRRQMPAAQAIACKLLKEQSWKLCSLKSTL